MGHDSKSKSLTTLATESPSYNKQVNLLSIFFTSGLQSMKYFAHENLNLIK